MSDIIHLLPDSVANQIAAGEVVQRPASVIKELVENAIDAGATEVQVAVTDAGRTSIQVVDNGTGMSETDARLSFERHATSKISGPDDLFNLRTMGFRGEALASIAAVSEVELRTRLSSAELGTRIVISASKLVSQEPVSCPAGSNFLVKNLFFNVPARRKFLKSNATELNNMLQEFERIVLVHPNISFIFRSNGAELYRLPAAPLMQRILAVFGKKMEAQLLPIGVDTSLVKISGYIGKPELYRKKGAHQYFFVNGRYMRHPYFHKAVVEAYEKLIPIGTQMSYFIYFEVDPRNIDVNIHPTKVEIKFEDEPAIWQILLAAIKEALGKNYEVPRIDFEPQDNPMFDRPGTPSGPVSPPKVDYHPGYDPFAGRGGEGRGAARGGRSAADWEKFFSDLDAKRAETSVAESPAMPDMAEKSSAIWQYKGRYLLMPMKSGLMFIDQHRAHVRVLYEQYLSQIRSMKGVSQGILFPEAVALSASEEAVLQEVSSDLAYLGFEITPLGGGSYAVQAMPEGTEGLDPSTLLHDMLHTAAETGKDVKSDVHSRLSLTLARSSAIVYGQVLSADEMAYLVDRLFATSSPNYGPDGKVVFIIMEDEQLRQSFL